MGYNYAYTPTRRELERSKMWGIIFAVNFALFVIVSIIVCCRRQSRRRSNRGCVLVAPGAPTVAGPSAISLNLNNAVTPAPIGPYPTTGPYPSTGHQLATGPYPNAGPYLAAGPYPNTGPYPTTGHQLTTGPCPTTGHQLTTGPCPTTGHQLTTGPQSTTGPYPTTGPHPNFNQTAMPQPQVEPQFNGVQDAPPTYDNATSMATKPKI